MGKREDSLKEKVAQNFSLLSPKPHHKNKPHYKCKIGNCQSVINGGQPTNLTQHLKQKHKDFFETIIRSSDDPKSLPARRLKFIQNCAEMISINGRAFKSLSDSGFKKLIGEELNTLRRTGYGKGLRGPEYTAVKKHIKHQAKRVKEEISKEVKDKFVALMVDTASRNKKTFMGLSLQYILNGRAVIRCIGMTEVTEEHSSINLKNMIMHRLNDFGINLKQLLSITSDNAANMIAMLKRFNMLRDDEESDEEEESDEDDENAATQQNDVEETNEEPESDDENTDWMELNDEEEAELDELLDDHDEYVKLIEECVNDLAKKTMVINGIRCAAHTLQLGVRDALKLSQSARFIGEIRDICKFLRKNKSIRELMRNNIYVCLPRADCKVRWSSLYRMVSVDRERISQHLLIGFH